MRRSHLTVASTLVVVALAVVLSALGLGPAASPASADDGPVKETVVGPLVRALSEDPGAGTTTESPPTTWVRTDDGEVRVDPAALRSIPDGAVVRVTLGASPAGQAADRLVPPRPVLAATVLASAQQAGAAAPSTVAHRVTVVRVLPPGAVSDPEPASQIVDALNGGVHDYWADQTGGIVQVSATGWPSWVSTSVGCTDPFGMFAQAASAVGFQPGPGEHLLLYIPSEFQITDCAGEFAEVGTGTASGGDMYIRAYDPNSASSMSYLTHVFGHNLGLGHSSYRQCWPYLEATTCRTLTRGDSYDVMGDAWDSMGALNAAQLDRLGVLPAGQRLVLAADGSSAGGVYALAPLEGPSGVRAIKLVSRDGSTYWLEYRTATGRDAWLPGNTRALEQGVLLRRAGSGGDTSLLLDGSPPANGPDDASPWGRYETWRSALPVGVQFSIPFGGAAFTVSVEGLTTASATVRISMVPSGDGSVWGPSTNRLPLGNWDGVSATGTTLAVSGWALDPDVSLQAVDVRVLVDGRGSTVTAGNSRPDLMGPLPKAGDRHGFSWSTSVAPGVHTVCVYVPDLEMPWSATSLGCRTVPVAVTTPRGSWDGLTVSGATVSVTGWAFDPDSPFLTSPVHVYVDGGGTALAADQSRPDVGTVFPAAGGSHGFSWSASVAPGQHRVCVYAIDNESPWTNTAFGCRTVAVQMTAPRGNWESVAVSGTTVSVAGWAFDPDAPSATSPVHVYVDGAGTALVADQSRPDVGAVFPAAGGSHGFAWSATVAPGEHTVCLYAIDVQLAWLHTDLGCRRVSVGTRSPRGNWESVAVSGTTVSVAGWAFDPDSPSTASAVHVYVDGGATALTANGSRPDVGAVFPEAGGSHGFTFSTTVAPGAHTVCVYAIDQEIPWRNTPFGCRSVTAIGP